nr:MAG TPA: hypothetical protein [Caudoviricetes sp.]
MTTIAIMNWAERHQTGQIVLRIFEITIGMPIVKFPLAKSALVSRIIKRLHPTHLLAASRRLSAAFSSKIAVVINSGSQFSKWFRATSRSRKASHMVLTVVGIGSIRNIFLVKSTIFRSISTPPHLCNLTSREPALNIIKAKCLPTHHLDKPLLKAIGTPAPNAIPDTISSSIICSDLLTTIVSSAREIFLTVRSVHLWPATFISMRNLSMLQQSIQLLHLGHVIPNPEFPGFLRHVSHFCISFRQHPWSLRFYAEYKAHSQPDYHTRMKPIIRQ